MPIPAFGAVYNPAGIAGARAALANAGVTPVFVDIDGHSIVEGYSAGSNAIVGANGTLAYRRAYSWVALLRAMLQADHGGGGEGMIPTCNTDCYSIVGSVAHPSPDNYGPFGVLNGTLAISFGGGANSTFNYGTLKNCRFLDFYTVDQENVLPNNKPSGSFAVVVDGTPIAVTQPTPVAGTHRRFTVDMGSLGDHTVVVRGGTTVNEYVYLWGLGTRAANTGVEVSKIGLAGKLMGDLAGDTTRLAWKAVYPSTFSICQCVVNDTAAQTALLTFQASAQRFLDASPGPVLFLNDNLRDTVGPIQQSVYGDVLRGLADANPSRVSVLDMSIRWNNRTAAQEAGSRCELTGSVHPGDGGMGDYARAVYAVLKG